MSLEDNTLNWYRPTEKPSKWSSIDTMKYGTLYARNYVQYIFYIFHTGNFKDSKLKALFFYI